MIQRAVLPPDTTAAERFVGAAPVFDLEIVIALGADGRVREIRLVGTPDSPELAPAIRAAIERADAARAFPPLPADVAGDGIEVQLRLFGSGSVMPPPVDAQAPVVAILEERLEVLRADVAARAIPGGGVPQYPPHLRRANVNGIVQAQFIVDARGRADVQSARSLVATHADFFAAVRDAMADMRFEPARIRGCPTTSWVRQRFEFYTDP